jgi:hypothetical protein
MFPGKGLQAKDVVIVFVGNEDGSYIGKGKAKPYHSFFCFHARQSCIHQHGVGIGSNIITIPVAAGIKRGDVQ